WDGEDIAMRQKESTTSGKARAHASDTGKTARDPLPDPAELSRQTAEQMAEIAEKSQRLVADFLSRQGAQAGAEEGIGLANPMAIGAAFLEMTQRMMSDPARLAEAQASLWNDYLRLWQQTAAR